MNGILTVRQEGERMKVSEYKANRLWRIGGVDLEAFLQRKQEPVSTREAK